MFKLPQVTLLVNLYVNASPAEREEFVLNALKALAMLSVVIRCRESRRASEDEKKDDSKMTDDDGFVKPGKMEVEEPVVAVKTRKFSENDDVESLLLFVATAALFGLSKVEAGAMVMATTFQRTRLQLVRAAQFIRSARKK